MKKLIILLFFFIHYIVAIIAQDSTKTSQFINPLNVPLVLSGNFGELRTNHFHSGLDFRTNGKTGLPVIAVADGYVSRIKVSSVGYGKALYIEHPNGTTTVYGHLLNFNDKIDQYTKSIQYKRESFSVDVSVPREKLSVKQGDTIALSGNSGSSGGPHLHFEIRNTQTEEALNPLKHGYSIPDKIRPKILSLYVYPLSDTSHVDGSRNKKKFDVVYYDGKFHVKRNPLIKVYGSVGFALEALDYLDGSWSKCGIYSMEMQLDQKKAYEFAFDKLSFSNMRYLNSHIDYELKRHTGHAIHKTFRDEGNRLNLYNDTLKGVLNIPNPKSHKVSFVVKDLAGNNSQLDVRLLSKKIEFAKDTTVFKHPFNYKQENKFSTDNFKLTTPKGCFYHDFDFQYQVDSVRPKKALSVVHKVHDGDTPVHTYIEMAIRPDSIPAKLQSKALLAYVYKNGKLSAMGGKYENGWIKTRLREFGNFCVTIDTIPPRIRSLSIQNNSRLIDSKRIRFKISDDFSGISSYKGTIDGKWVLFEYDAKKALLTYIFDKDRIEFKKKHNLKLEVEDQKGNITSYKATFIK